MVFGFGKKKGKGPRNTPLEAFDALLDDLERQAQGVRRGAATLLTLRGELTRDAERYRRQLAEVSARAAATAELPGPSGRVLRRDRSELERRLAESEGALLEATHNAEMLLEVAQALAKEIEELRTERASARSRLMVGQAVTEALRQRSERVRRVLEVDAARDEVEKAFALAELYREDAKGGAKS